MSASLPTGDSISGVHPRVELARSLSPAVPHFLEGLEAFSYTALPKTRTKAPTRVFVFVAPIFALLYAVTALAMAARTTDVGFNLSHGTEVLSVASGSGAASVGLQSGDKIVSVNGIDTVDPVTRYRAVRGVALGDTLNLVVNRRGTEVVIPGFVAQRNIPVGSTLTTILGLALLLVAIYAGRGRWNNHPRAFLRSTVVYVIFLSGLHSLDVVLGSALLGPIWLAAMVLAAPLTCHFMMKFPAGPERIGATRLALLYVPTAILGLSLIVYQLAFALGKALPGYAEMMGRGSACAGLLAAVYLCTGAAARVTRVRKRSSEIDPAAAKWLKINGVCVALPFLGGVVWVFVDQASFLGTGFKQLATATVIAGSFCLLMAMAQVPFGQLDRYWRRSSGYVVAIFVAAGSFLGLTGLGVLGGGAAALSGSEIRAALFATVAAAIIFGPLRSQVQHVIDMRFGKNRTKARQLLREASEAAVATLDVSLLQTGVVHRIRTALGAKGVAIYSAGAEGSWSREAWAGHSPLPRDIDGELGKSLVQANSSRLPVDLDDGLLAVPLPIGDGVNAAVVVAPKDGARFDDEERDLLRAAAAGLVVAVGNARAHTALQDLTERLKRQVDVAENRRREIARLKDRVEEENRALIGELASRRGNAPVIGQGLKPTFELVQKVARTNSSVLVRGETGVGKELVARAVHAASPRRDGPFIVVDCGAIAPTLIESTLFGHVRGAFTGAVRDSLGAFRSAEGGTIFLDEIGELPPELQPKLLRVLQERVVHPVGASEPIAVNVRVVSGTHRDLASGVETGSFRQDLLYRLQVIEVKVPPLRRRRGDIEALAEHFLARGGQKQGRPAKRLAPDAMAALLEHEWPGNVRELEHTLEAAAVYAEGDEIRATDLPIADKIFRSKGRAALASGPSPVGSGGAPREGIRETLQDLEKTRLLEALAEQDGNKSATARALGLSRGALLRRLKRYEIHA